MIKPVCSIFRARQVSVRGWGGQGKAERVGAKQGMGRPVDGLAPGGSSLVGITPIPSLVGPDADFSIADLSNPIPATAILQGEGK